MAETAFADPQSPADFAALYRMVGLQVVPAVTPGEQKEGQGWKRPRLTNWTEFQDVLTDKPMFDGWYGANGKHATRANMGLITGSASNGVFCLDLDVKPGASATEWWMKCLAVHNNGMEPETPSQRTGGGGRQLLFRAPVGWSPPTFKTATLGVDVRGQGGFMMAPPSLHESGRHYEWEDGREPWSIDIETAPTWLIEEIEKVRAEHGGGAPGAPRERTISQGAKDAFGLDIDDREDKMARAVWGVAITIRQAFPDEADVPFPGDWKDEADAAWERYLFTTKTRLKFDAGDTNASLLDREGRGKTDWTRKLNRALAQWNGKLADYAKRPNPNATALTVVEPAATPVTLPQVAADLFDPWEQYLVPSFPLDALPVVLRRHVETQALSTGADASALAMAALVSVAGAMDQESTLRMMRTGRWTVHPRLWCVLVGDPSAKKTPAIRACTWPLRQAEARYVRQHKVDTQRYEEDRKDDKNATKPPPPLRFVINDTTVEKLGEILSHQNRGVLIEHDELSGWIGAMDKYGGGKGSASDRAFWAEAYNGGPKTVDRLGRGTTFVENLCVSFLGGVQPDRLTQLGDLASDGLLQRFLPVMMRRSHYPQEVDDQAVTEAYEQLILYVSSMRPAHFAMTHGAIEASNRFRRWLHDLEHTEGLGKSIRTFAGKLAGVHGSLSLALHFADDPHNVEDRVDEATVLRAERILREFCIPHAIEFYRTASDQGDWDHLRALASFILTSDKARFTASDFTTGVRSMRGLGLWDVGQKVSPLVAGGWLAEEDKGRAWVVEKGVREALAARREDEIARKAEVLAAIRGMKGGGSE